MEYNPLLDSSNLSMEDWATIGQDIGRHYQQFNGFVILHGTDTMAYTASALSFMCDNLGKAIILTGSQVGPCWIGWGFLHALCVCRFPYQS